MTTKRKPATKTPAAPAAQTPAELKLLSGADILASDDYKFDDVEVPEWGGLVRIKGLTGEERDRFEASTVETRGKNVKQNFRNLRARLVVAAAIDGEGNQLFERYQVEELGKKSAAALDRCFAAAQRLSKLSDEDIDELVEDF